MRADVPVNRSGFPALLAFAGGGSAVSQEADAVRAAAAAALAAAERSQALFGEKAAAIEQLAMLAIECGEENWDGSGAAAVDLEILAMARRFLRALPDGMPLPEFAAEPDGSVSLDWIRSRNHLFSVSIGRRNRLAYAWLDGSDTGHGVARFDGHTVPPKITDGIAEIMGSGRAALRAA